MLIELVKTPPRGRPADGRTGVEAAAASSEAAAEPPPPSDPKPLPPQLLRLLLQVLQPTAHEERLLGVVVVLALRDRVERVDGLLELDERPRDVGELLGHERVLRQ